MRVRKIKTLWQPPENQRYRKRILLFSLLLSVALAIPLDTFAQGGLFTGGPVGGGYEYQGVFNNQGFGVTNGLFGYQGFRGTNAGVFNQGFGGFQGGITNQGFNETPLSSGLLVIILAGAGYAGMKRSKKQEVRNKKN